MAQGRNEKWLECIQLTWEPLQRARFSSKSGGITSIFNRSPSYAAASL